VTTLLFTKLTIAGSITGSGFNNFIDCRGARGSATRILWLNSFVDGVETRLSSCDGASGEVINTALWNWLGVQVEGYTRFVIDGSLQLVYRIYYVTYLKTCKAIPSSM
jgi:hypothetical protein